MPDDQLLPPPPKKKNNPDIGADGLLPPPPKKKAKEPSSKNWWNGGKGGNFAGLLGGGVEKSKVEKSAVPKLPIEDISEYNKRFEDATGHKPLNLGSDLPQIKKAREEKKYLTYRDIEEKEIKPVLDDVSRGVVQPEDLKKLYQQPHGRKIVTEAINQELPEVGTMGLDEEVFGNEKKWEGIAQAIQNKNRQQGVDAQNQSEFELDNELANSLKDYTYGQDHIAVRGGGEAVSERQQKSFGDINTTSPDELSAALRNINNSTKVWDSEGKEVDKKTLAKKIGTRLFQIKAQENIHPEIIQLFDKIKTAVSKVPVEWKKQGLSDDLVNTDAEYVSDGLNYIKDADPGRYAMIMGSIDGLGKIAEMDYQQLVGLGKDINSFRKFKQGEYVKKDNRSFLTTQGKKALLGGWLYEELKRTGKNKQTFRIPQKDILEAYKNVPEELKDDDLVRDIIKDEVGPAFGFLPIARGEGIPKRGLGRQILTNTADPFAGILNTIDYSFDSPFGAYQKSKELDRGDNTVINAKGEFTNRSDDKFFNKAVGGLFAFLTQVGIARGIGAVTAKGTNAMIGRVAPRAATVTTSEAALNVGTPLSIIAQQYGDEYVDFLEKTGSPTKAALGAFVSTATQGAIERFVLPDVKIADQAALLFARKNLAKEIIDVVENGGGKAGVGKLIKDFTANTLSTFGKEAIAEENLQNFANYLTEAVISPKTAQNRDLMQESWDITKAATTQMAIPAIFGGAGETKMKRGLNKVQLNHIGVNADAYQDALDNSLTRGIVTQDEYDLSSKIIQLHRNNILNAPKYDSKGELISAERQLEYAYQSTVQETLQQQADKQKDKVQREPIDKKIEEADKIKRQIFYGEEAEGLPPKEGEPVVIDQDRDLMDESDTDALLDELKSKAGELEQGVDLDYFQTKAAEDPAKYINKYGEETVMKLIESVPTETLQGNLDLFIEMNPDNPSVKILDNIIAKREQPENPPIDQVRELADENTQTETISETASPGLVGGEQASNTDNVEVKKAEINKRYDEEVSKYETKIKQAEEDIAANKKGTYLPSKNKQKEVIADINENREIELAELEKQSLPTPKGNTDNVGGGISFDRKQQSEAYSGISDVENNEPKKSIGEYISSLFGVKNSRKSAGSEYYNTDRKINGRDVVIRVSDHPHIEDNKPRENDYTVSIVVNGDKPEGLTINENYAELNVKASNKNVEDKIGELYDHFDEIQQKTQSLSQPSTPTVQEGSVLSENSKKEIGELFDNKGVKDFRLNIPDYYNELIEKGLATKNGDKSVSITDEGKKVVLESRVSDADKKLSFSEDKPNTLEESYEIARKLFSSSGGGDTKYSRIRLKSGKTVQLRISDHNIHTNPQTTDTYILPITFNTNTFSHGKKGYEKFITEPLSEKEIFDYVKSEIEKFGEIEYFKESQSPNIFNTIRQRENDLKQLGSLKSATGSVQEGKGEALAEKVAELEAARDMAILREKVPEMGNVNEVVPTREAVSAGSNADNLTVNKRKRAELKNRYTELKKLFECLTK